VQEWTSSDHYTQTWIADLSIHIIEKTSQGVNMTTEGGPKRTGIGIGLQLMNHEHGVTGETDAILPASWEN
jgi:hypothetical protein